MRGIPQTKARPQVILAVVVTASGDFAHLPEHPAADPSFEPHFRADGRPVGGRTHEPQSDPIVAVTVVSIKEVGLFVYAHDKASVSNEQIRKAVIVVISPGTTLTLAAVVNHTAL